MRLKATTRWVSPILLIPNQGAVHRPLAGQVLQVTDDQGRWLVDQGYAESTTVGASAPAKAAKAVAEKTPKPAPEPKPDTVPVVEAEEESLAPWQTEALAFFSETMDKEAIDERVNGIGPKTAARILKADRPLTWAVLDDILSASQVQAVKSVFDQSEET